MIKFVWLALLLPWLLLPQSSSSSAPTIAGCSIFPADNIWNTRIDTLPRHALSNEYVAAIGVEATMHPDFGSGLWEGGPIGIPFIVVPANQSPADIIFTEYGDESDPGPYPVPADAPIEGGPNADGDRHVLVVQQGSCILYELFASYPVEDYWQAESGAVYDLSSHALREEGWTSADAAGLPILPGLVRYDELLTGEIRHALRFTAPETQKAYVWPARHHASDILDPSYPPMGQRFRLRGDFPVGNYSPQIQVILRAIQRYGLILADNGSSWYLSGAPDERWDNDMLRELKTLQGSDFEAVDVSSLQVSPNSGQTQ
jgi:hypothetical protein